VAETLSRLERSRVSVPFDFSLPVVQFRIGSQLDFTLVPGTPTSVRGLTGSSSSTVTPSDLMALAARFRQRTEHVLPRHGIA
jgi:hypothetical protein